MLLGEVASELGSLVGVRTDNSFLVSSDRGIVIGTYDEERLNRMFLKSPIHSQHNVCNA